MEKIIICIWMILLLSCNKKQKSSENTITQNNYSTENSLETNIKNATSENQIIPGNRIGNIIIEENAIRVLDSLGKPDSGNAAMGKAISTWKKGDSDLLTLYTSTQMGVEDFSRVKAVRSLSKDFRTVDNLGVSSCIEALKKYYRLDPVGKFTENGKHYFLYTTPKGIAFEIGMNQKCNGVLLYSQGTDPENLYIPMYPDFKKL